MYSDRKKRLRIYFTDKNHAGGIIVTDVEKRILDNFTLEEREEKLVHKRYTTTGKIKSEGKRKKVRILEEHSLLRWQYINVLEIRSGLLRIYNKKYKEITNSSFAELSSEKKMRSYDEIAEERDRQISTLEAKVPSFQDLIRIAVRSNKLSSNN